MFRCVCLLLCVCMRTCAHVWGFTNTLHPVRSISHEWQQSLSCVHVCVRTCARLSVCLYVPVCPVCSSVSTHCQVVEAARTVKEEVESTSEDCREELIQLEVGSCPHTRTHAHAHTHTRIYTHGIHAHHILVTCTICSGCGSGVRGMSDDVRQVLVARWNVIIM